MEIEFQQLESWIRSYMLPLCRLSALLMVMSVISARSISPRFRLVLAISITALIAPTLPPPLKEFPLISFQSVIMVAHEVLIGLSFGFISRLLLETFVLGAQVIAMQTGLGFASMIDPTNGLQVPVLSQFFLMLSTLLFLALNGHLIMIEMLVMSFQTLPVGSDLALSMSSLKALVDWASYLFAAALMMALAAVLSLLMINISFGVMTRAAPQLNIFAVGFPITLISGLGVVWLTLSGFLQHFELQFNRAKLLMCNHLFLECG